jgi:hypothetical protein
MPQQIVFGTKVHGTELHKLQLPSCWEVGTGGGGGVIIILYAKGYQRRNQLIERKGLTSRLAPDFCGGCGCAAAAG